MNELNARLVLVAMGKLPVNKLSPYFVYSRFKQLPVEVRRQAVRYLTDNPSGVGNDWPLCLLEGEKDFAVRRILVPLVVSVNRDTGHDKRLLVLYAKETDVNLRLLYYDSLLSTLPIWGLKVLREFMEADFGQNENVRVILGNAIRSILLKQKTEELAQNFWNETNSSMRDIMLEVLREPERQSELEEATKGGVA